MVEKGWFFWEKISFMSNTPPEIEREDIRIADGPIGPFGPMHKCHLTQKETETGKRSMALSGRDDCLIIGFNPRVARYGDELKAHCAYCGWYVSDECQEWLDNV